MIIKQAEKLKSREILQKLVGMVVRVIVMVVVRIVVKVENSILSCFGSSGD